MISHVAAVNLFAEMHDSGANRVLHRQGRICGTPDQAWYVRSNTLAVKKYSPKPAGDFIRQASANGLNVSVLLENDEAAFTIIED